MSKRSQYTRLLVLAASSLPFVAQPGWSSGFALSEQNASSLGTAYAGAASIAEDASTNFYNCAGLTRLGNQQIAFSTVWVDASSEVTATTSPTASVRVPGQPFFLGTGSASPKGDQSLIPALHYEGRISDSWVFGLSIASPFGLKTKYQNTSIARYAATDSTLRTTDIAPSIALDLQNGLSLGVGADAVYLIAKLDSRVGFGNINTDGYLENTASNWGLGWHAGALYEFNDCTRVGVSYRSNVRITPRGQASYLAPPALQSGVAQIQLGVRSKINLPETATASIYHAFNDAWAAMLDVQWTHWKRFKTLTLNYIDDGSSVTYQEHFKNTTRVSLGVSYQWDEALRLRLGTAFDKTPTQDAYRSIRIPDQNRTWAAVGAQYRFTKCLALDLGYAHLFFKKAVINEAAPTLVNGTVLRTAPAQTFVGKSKARADLIGAQLTWDF